MNTVEVLTQARDLIADPEHWTQGVYAQDANGIDLEYGFTPGAVCWCATGALQNVLDETYFGSTNRATNVLYETALSRYGMVPAHVNDRLGHDAVLAMYDAAIERAKAQS